MNLKIIMVSQSPQSQAHDVCSCSVMSNSLRPHGLYSLTGFSAHGIFQARIVEWFAIPTSGDLSVPGIEPASLASRALAGGFFTKPNQIDTYDFISIKL